MSGTVTWYEPTRARNIGACFCGQPVAGHTTYFNGVERTVRFQCVTHLPVEGRQFNWRQAVTS